MAIGGLLSGERKALDKARFHVCQLRENSARKELTFVRIISRVKPDFDGNMISQLETLACQQGLFNSVETVVETARTHVLNSHERPSGAVTGLLRKFDQMQATLIRAFAEDLGSANPSLHINGELDELMGVLEDASRQVLSELYSKERQVKNTTLLLILLTELTDFVREMHRAGKLNGAHN